MNRKLLLLCLLFISYQSFAEFDFSFPSELVDTSSLVLEIIPQDSCEALSDLLAVGEGGTGPYWYLWSGGHVGNLLEDVPAGSYCVTITDATFCTTEACYTVPDVLDIQIISQNISCSDICDGFVQANPIGGTAPYDFEWNSGDSTNIIQYLHPGDYTVTITDALGCTAVATETITVPDALVVDITSPLLPCGAGNIGTATANISGGTPPYNYQWSDGQTGITATGLTPGETYFITVLDANLCFINSYVTILTETEISVNVFTTDAVCGAPSGGSAFAMATQGTPPYSYLWSNGGTTISIMDLEAGTYSVVVTDANGCLGQAFGEVEEAPADINLFFEYEFASNCFEFDGSITVVATQGTPPYTYLWDNGTTEATLDGINSGIYFVTVTDANGCPASGAAQLQVPTFLEIDFIQTGNCEADNTLEAFAPTGTAPFSYSWNTGDTTMLLTNIPSGQYHVTIEDANGCTGADTIDIAIDQNPDLLLSGMDPTCFNYTNGFVEATVNNFPSGNSFLWNTGDTTALVEDLSAGTYIVSVTNDQTGCATLDSIELVNPDSLYVIIEGIEPNCFGDSTGTLTALIFGGDPTGAYIEWNTLDTGMVLENVPAGEYQVDVLVGINCPATSDIFILGQPDELEVEFMVDMPTCLDGQGGSIEAIISGGTAPYTLLWNTGDTTAVLTGLAAGNYELTVTDASGCEAVYEVDLTDITAPEVMVTATLPLCFGSSDGALSAAASGGTPPYNYEWSNGVMGPDNPGIPSGDYILSVTDDIGCEIVEFITLDQPTQIEIDIQIMTEPCPGTDGGVIGASVSGGTIPYLYEWSTGDDTPVIMNITAGIYYLTVTDNNGCTAQDSVTLNELPGMEIEVDPLGATCFGGSTGEAIAFATGGAGSYTYLWSNGEVGAQAFALPAGLSFVTVTDANGCMDVGEVIIDEFADPFNCSAYVVMQISSVNGSDGSVGVVEPDDQDGPFNFAWSNGGTTQFIDGLSAGIYEVTITDESNGCLSICSVELVNPAKLGDYVWEDMNQNGQQDGNEQGVGGITVTLSGITNGGDPITLNTSTAGNGSYLFDGLIPGIYDLTFSNLPTDFEFTVPGVGDPNTDSDVIFPDGSTGMYVLAAGDCKLDIDAGIFIECINYDDPGTISGDEYLCGPGNDPGVITEVTPPSGGMGATEFIWMYSLEAGPFDPGSWILIPGATGPTYDPGVIYETTYFARCVRREGCTEYLESNIIEKVVGTEAVAFITDPGTVCVNESVLIEGANNGPGAVYSWDFGNDATPATSSNVSEVVSWSGFGLKTIQLTVTNNGCTSYHSIAISVSNAEIICVEPIADSPIGDDFPIGPAQGNPDQRSLLESGLLEIELYPNPTLDVSFLSRSTTDYMWKVEIQNLMGSTIFAQLWTKDSEKLRLDCAAWPKGLYLLSIQNQEGLLVVKKLIVE